MKLSVIFVSISLTACEKEDDCIYGIEISLTGCAAAYISLFNWDGLTCGSSRQASVTDFTPTTDSLCNLYICDDNRQ